MCLYVDEKKTRKYFNTPQNEYLYFYKVVCMWGGEYYSEYKNAPIEEVNVDPQFKSHFEQIDKAAISSLKDVLNDEPPKSIVLGGGCFHLYQTRKIARQVIQGLTRKIIKCKVYRDDVLAFGQKLSGWDDVAVLAYKVINWDVK